MLWAPGKSPGCPPLCAALDGVTQADSSWTDIVTPGPDRKKWTDSGKTDLQRYNDTETERQRDRDRETETERQRQRDRDRIREKGKRRHARWAKEAFLLSSRSGRS